MSRTSLNAHYFLKKDLLPNVPRWPARRQFRSADFAKITAPTRIEISPAGLGLIGGIAHLIQ